MLEAAGAQLAADYPGVLVHAVVGDFQQHVGLLPAGDRRLIVFLGGTIGNLLPPERQRLLAGAAGGGRAATMPCCWAPTWSRTRAGWSPPTTTRRG